MNYKLLALCVLTPALLTAHDTIFMPYDGPYPVSLENRIEGIFGCHEYWQNDSKNNFEWNFKGYIKYSKGFFSKLGATLTGFSDHCNDYNVRHVGRVGADIQLGKYWDCWGALRVGLFANVDGPGIGGTIGSFIQDLSG